MPDYRRHRLPGGTYFFTYNLLERKSALLVEHIDLLRESVRVVKAQRPFHIDAWVVLPDHMHTVWTLPEGDADYSGRWRAIKIAFAKGLPKNRTPVRVTRSTSRARHLAKAFLGTHHSRRCRLRGAR